MYSKNDYRYYLENRLMHPDDFLAHYGVKGMKWRNHKKSSQNIERDVIVPDKIERDIKVPDKIERDVKVTNKKKKRSSIFKPKNQKVEIISRSEQSPKKSKKSSDYHESIDLKTGKKVYTKKTKREKELEQYGREAAIELNKQNAKKKKKKH